MTSFFTLLKEEMDKSSMTPDRLFNMDETGVSTVHDPGRIIELKGQKQVGQIVRAEGENITAVCLLRECSRLLCATDVRISSGSDVGSPSHKWACGSCWRCTAKWLDGFEPLCTLVGAFHQIC